MGLPFTFTEALDMAKERFAKNPNWRFLEGTPWENDAPVIAAELMCLAARAALRVGPIEDSGDQK